MFLIERRFRDWVVRHNNETISVHPSREEAERAIEWLFSHRAAPQLAVARVEQQRS
jgi:hypothetical protein